MTIEIPEPNTLLPALAASRPSRGADPVQVDRAVTDFLDLSSPSRALHNILDQPAEFKESFLKQLAVLLTHEVVGTETVESGTETRERFVTTGIAAHDKLTRRLDLRA